MDAELKHFEHPTLKVPYELLNKKFRNAQKNIDREISSVQSSLSGLENMLGNEDTCVAEVKTALDQLHQQLATLKNKTAVNVAAEVSKATSCKRRIDHLRGGGDQQPNSKIQWKRKRLDRILVEYFLREGYYTTALGLAHQSNIEDLTSLELFLIAKSIEESLQKQDTSKCLSWCHENKTKLRRMRSTLEFRLRQQEVIEFIRRKDFLGAVQHARKYLCSFEPEQGEELQLTMGLLAYSNHDRYKELMNPDRWQQLVKQFRLENFRLYQLADNSVFTVALQTGLSALKTPQCYDETSDRNPQCPVCSDHLNKLAEMLPFAHCASSRLICHLSGQPMDENNPPMMLPNGKVYSYNSLTSMAVENNGVIVCPRTKDVCQIGDTEKVFVM